MCVPFFSIDLKRIFRGGITFIDTPARRGDGDNDNDIRACLNESWKTYMNY